MTRLSKAAPELPKPASGFTVVIGPRSSLSRHSDRPWAAVLTDAQRGVDGLRADLFGSPTARPGNQEFMLREMAVGPDSIFYGYPALMEQRW